MITAASDFDGRYKIPLGRRITLRQDLGFQSATQRTPGGSGKAASIGAPPEKHMLTIAPTGAGKFRSVLVPELLTYPGSIVCLDIKGEAYCVTARRRREMGQRVVRLDPFEVIGPSSDALNFFDLFSLPNADLETDAQMIASIISDGNSVAKDPFWDLSARGLIAGVIVFLAHHRDKAEHLLKSLREILYADDTDYRLAVWLDTIKPMHPLARGELAAYLSQPERETRPSTLATVRSYFKVLFSQRVESAFSHSTFSLKDFSGSQQMSVYLVVPPNKLESHRRLVRLWMTTLMAAITSRRQIPRWPTLMLIDEASQLGHFPSLLQAITLGRGYGVRVHSFWQDLSQLMVAYPTEWRTIVNNCGVKQAFGMTDAFMAHGLDELFQVSMKDLISVSPREQWLLLNGRTVRARKLDYLKDRKFAGMFDANPYHGGPWPDVSAPMPELPLNNNMSLRNIAELGRTDSEDNREKGTGNV
ncbi:MAG TPA: type IV secretory system conjugative DNA transfer family protein [Planctomycetaceae bacterium]|nr:type IV secretory system conjugative DNA transfer family protein [Planctomycetaceae bacterium]HQZ65496.1 type IV secretory system conjugative DNA transfer family protein [Planctomycetaceae bacterium]HRA89937.1 type IV secretory system conjugative DNA transfer family protein [Planctomycetaceae bacterium]